MKNKIYLIGLASALALTSCTNESALNKSHQLASKTVNLKELTKNTKTNKEASEKLALFAEKMALNPGGFIFADEVFDQALEQDSTNTRALFYKGILAPLMAQKGILKRINPWLKQQKPEEQEKHQQSIDEIPQSDIKDFLLSGSEDIGTITDIQNHIDVTRSALLSSRSAIVSIKRSTLELHTIFYSGGTSKVITDCAPKKISQGVYELRTCPQQSSLELNLTRPDFEVLALFYSSIAVGTTWAYTSYNLEDLTRISKALELETPKNGVIDYQKALSILRSEPQFLKIRNPEALKSIVSLGAEGMEAVRYALKHQPELCRKGKPDQQNRPGFLFPEGFCTNAEASHSIMTLNAILEGPFQIAKTQTNSKGEETDNRYVTEINVGNFLNNPPQDLRDLLPTEYDEQAHQIKFADETLGGLFPNADASTFFKFPIDGSSVSIQPAKALK